MLVLLYYVFLIPSHTDTPLGIACGRNSHVVCITSVLSGGAHIDFRGLGSLTPMHRAAIGGNAQAIMVRYKYIPQRNHCDCGHVYNYKLPYSQ